MARRTQMHQMSSLGNTVKTLTLLAALAGLLVFAIAMNGFVYWKSDSLALRAKGARELNPGEAGQGGPA